MGKSVQVPAHAVPRRLLTRCEAAELLAVSPGTLSRWAAERQGPPFVKLGTSDKAGVRYPADELESFIAARTKHPK
jgi:predicted DNA-binding transcriptional regulator AlpA